MRRVAGLLMFSLCLILFAVPASGAAGYGSLVILPGLALQAEFQMYGQGDPFQGLILDLKSKWGTEGPPEGRRRPD